MDEQLPISAATRAVLTVEDEIAIRSNTTPCLLGTLLHESRRSAEAFERVFGPMIARAEAEAALAVSGPLAL